MGAKQDPHWLALKNAYRVRSGVSRNQPKGTKAHPYILVSAPNASYPNSAELALNNAVPTTYEPSDGNHPNFGGGTSITDDARNYYNDGNFFDLCGPGAADVALFYWPAPSNYGNYASVRDPKAGVSTTWNGSDIDGVYRMRGYMAHISWQIQAPGWSQPGMMEQYAGGGVTLQTETQAMNWEASNEDASTWNNYFYVTMWWNVGNASTLHNDIASDVTGSNVPVVAEVNAALMPNWNEPGKSIYHFITIIGYDDVYGIYYYTDTCGRTTACGDQTYGSDGGVHTVSQSDLWNAITNIPVNENTGDGGWVW